MNTLQAINELLRDLFDNPEISVTPASTANDVDGWDSLSHVNVILAVEAKFGVRFGQREVLTFKNVGDMVRAIDKRRGASPS